MDVRFRTITPLWTGDAWRQNRRIMPQSILGSMRFWFDVFCQAVGWKTAGYDAESVDSKKFHKNAMSFLESNAGTGIFDLSMKILDELGLSLSSIIFGCEGWRGVIGIKGIEVRSFHSDHRPRLPDAIAKKRDEPDGKWIEITKYEVKKRLQENYHIWFFPNRSFYGEGTISFVCADPILKENLLFPLLAFIQDYGFLGGKNNVGFGRVQFYEGKDGKGQDKPLNREAFGFSRILENMPDIKIKDAVEEVSSFDDLLKCSRLGFYRYDFSEVYKDIKKEQSGNNINQNITYIDIIKFLIREKSKERIKEKYGKKRHFIFGSTFDDEYKEIKGPNATKIIPWCMGKGDGISECGFVSVCFMKDFGRQRRPQENAL